MIDAICCVLLDWRNYWMSRVEIAFILLGIYLIIVVVFGVSMDMRK